MKRWHSLAAAAAFAIAAMVLYSVTAAAENLAAGDPAPDFELYDQHGRMHSIEDYRGQWITLYFYPKDDTPGCTTEACEFRDNIFAFRDRNCLVLGVSLDDVDSHREFAEKHGLPFPLLADTDGMAADAYGVRTRMLGFSIAKRQTFLIDPAGRIARHYREVDPTTHSKQVLADLDALQN